MRTRHESNPHIMFPLAVSNDQEHLSKTMDIFFTAPLHISWVNRSMGTNPNKCGSSRSPLLYISWILHLSKKKISANMDLLLQPRYIFLGSFTSQKLIAGYKDLLLGLCYIFLVPYTDQEKALTHTHPHK